jgi:chemotaxis signal transduction protein
MTAVTTADVPASATGLLCLAGRARIVVPIDDIVQVIEYPVSTRLPLAGRFVGGLGIFAGRVLISVAIDAKLNGSVLQRQTKGLLVKTGDATAAAWAIEVSQVRAIVDVEPAPIANIIDHPEKASFVSWRKTRQDEVVGWIDVARMIAELSRERSSSRAS